MPLNDELGVGSIGKPAGTVAIAPVGYLIITNVPADAWWVAVESVPKTLGRAATADVPIPARYASVSRVHAEVRAVRQSIRIRDLGSRCGTRVNGVGIPHGREATVAVGDRLWIGGLELSVVSELVVVDSEPSGDMPLPDLNSRRSGRLSTQPLPPHMLLGELSEAEMNLVLWMSRGLLDDVELGRKLHRSPHTVRTQMNSIFRKLNVRSRAQLIGLLNAQS